MTERVLIKDLDPKNKPRERMTEKGASALSDIELLAILLKSGGENLSATDLSAQLIKSYKNLRNLFESDLNHLTKNKHIGLAKAATIVATAELCKRVYLEDTEDSIIEIKNPSQAYKLIRKDLYSKKQEHLYLISLNSRKKYISKDLICIGSVNETLIPVRDIIRKALSNNAVHIIIAHNHPSNDPSPSQEDILVTEKVASACEAVGISLLDHIITSNQNFVSIKSLDLFESNKLKKKGGEK